MNKDRPVLSATALKLTEFTFQHSLCSVRWFAVHFFSRGLRTRRNTQCCRALTL